VSGGKYGLRDRFWIKLYVWARNHLPEGFVDEVWQAWIRQRIEVLRGRYGDSFVTWVATDLVPDDPNIFHHRETRLRQREVRNLRKTP